jgi:uncharacterized membrane protein (UPF0136 family)
MHPTAIFILWTYTTLLIAGGAFGFIKAGSKASLIASIISAIPLVLVAKGLLPWWVATVVLTALVVVFVKRFAKTRAWMPAGMLILLSSLTDLALLLFHFGVIKA